MAASKKSIGSLFIDIEGRTAKLEADLAKTKSMLSKVAKETQTLSNGFQKAFGLAKAAIVAVASIHTIKMLEHLTLNTLEQMRAQMKLAEVTGLSVNDVKAFTEASEFLGVTELDLVKTMKELYKLQSDVRAGTKKATQEIEKMGISIEEFATLSPGDLFETVVTKMNQIRDASTRAALSSAIFGKQAMNLQVLFQNGGTAIKNAREEIDQLKLSLDEYDTARVTVAMKAVTELEKTWTGFKQRMSLGLTPLVYTFATKMSHWLAAVDIEKFAKKVSEWTLKVVSFLITVPERIELVFERVKASWYGFITKFNTSDGMLSKIFGSPEENDKALKDAKAKIADLEASIRSASTTLEGEFGEKVEALLNAPKKLAPVVTSATSTILPWMREMVDAFSSSMQQMTNVVDTFIDEGSIKFGDFFRDLVKTMVKTFMKLSLINPMLNAVFGGLMGGSSGAGGGWWTNLPSMFGAGSGKAVGGPVMAGDTKLIGERGPELMSFGRSGYITPNDRMVNRSGGATAGPSFVFNQTFSSGLQRSELASIVPSIIEQSKAAVANTFLRGGSYRRALSS